MIAAGMGVAWVAYGIGSWGWVLLRGWNITPRQWFSPLHPYQWPKYPTDPPNIPKGRLWPGGPGQVATQGPASGTQANPGGVA